MSFLSGLFGNGGNSSSSTDANSSNFTNDFDAALGLDYSTTSYESYTDGDESYESADSQDFGLNLDVGNLIDSMTESFSDNDQVSFG